MSTPALDKLRDPLEAALLAYEQLYSQSIRFQTPLPFTSTPEKPNYARTVVPISNDTTTLGEMYVIVFLPQDGTGDNKTYTRERLIIPSKYQFAEKPERVFPRSKTGIVCEGFFPLFSINPKGKKAMFAASLEELTLDPETSEVRWAWNLGLSTKEYPSIFNKDIPNKPDVTYTTGTKDGTRFGDPHAIYNATENIQIVGFLSIRDTNSPLVELTKNWNFPF